MRCGLGRDGGEAFDNVVEFEAAVEAVFIGDEIARSVFGTTRSAGAGDGALEVAEAGIDPLEFVHRRPTAGGVSSPS